MSLKQRIKQDMHEAMRSKDQDRLRAIRMLRAAIQRREVDERTTLDDAEIVLVADKLVKQSREAVEQFSKGGREDLVAKENSDIAVMQAYLPKQLADNDLEKLIAEAVSKTGAASMKDMGKVIGVLRPQVQGRTDMGKLSAKVKVTLGD